MISYKPLPCGDGGAASCPSAPPRVPAAEAAPGARTSTQPLLRCPSALSQHSPAVLRMGGGGRGATAKPPPPSCSDERRTAGLRSPRASSPDHVPAPSRTSRINLTEKHTAPHTQLEGPSHVPSESLWGRGAAPSAPQRSAPLHQHSPLPYLLGQLRLQSALQAAQGLLGSGLGAEARPGHR